MRLCVCMIAVSVCLGGLIVFVFVYIHTPPKQRGVLYGSAAVCTVHVCECCPDCFVGRIQSVAQLSEQADGFNYFYLNPKRDRGVWKRGEVGLWGVKG